jgi:hypothetical protein
MQSNFRMFQILENDLLSRKSAEIENRKSLSTIQLPFNGSYFLGKTERPAERQLLNMTLVPNGEMKWTDTAYSDDFRLLT